jgi:alpha-L-arabinofuranosidase
MPSPVQARNEHGHGKFFRLRLLIASNEQIGSYIDSMDKEALQIRSESFRLAWYLRGGATYEDVMNMSMQERKLISELAKENIETTKKSNLPWF